MQTYSPEHPVIRHLVDGRYEAFLGEELEQREAASLVPFSRACLLRLAGPSASRTATAASSLAEHLRTRLMQDGWLLIGPAPAPVARVAGNSRWQLLLHGPAGSDCPYRWRPSSGRSYPATSAWPSIQTHSSFRPGAGAGQSQWPGRSRCSMATRRSRSVIATLPKRACSSANTRAGGY